MYPFSLCGCIYTYVYGKEVTYMQAYILIEDRGSFSSAALPFARQIME